MSHEELHYQIEALLTCSCGLCVSSRHLHSRGCCQCPQLCTQASPGLLEAASVITAPDTRRCGGAKETSSIHTLCPNTSIGTLAPQPSPPGPESQPRATQSRDLKPGPDNTPHTVDRRLSVNILDIPRSEKGTGGQALT
jgi:hypothetical protein